MTIDGKLLRGLFEHERLKPTMIRMDKRMGIKKSHELRNIYLTHLTQPCQEQFNHKTLEQLMSTTYLYSLYYKIKILAAGSL